MERTDQDFKDGLALDLFSPKNRTLTVKQNFAPLNAAFITGASGEPFVALSNYSYIIAMNETANDLIAKVEIPHDPVMLNSMGINPANTFVVTLAADKKSWILNDQTRNVHISENNTRIIKMTSLDGEYMLVGRKTLDTSNIFLQFGQGATRTFNMTGGPGTQEQEFIDGLRFTTQTDKDMALNVDIKQGVNPGTLPANTQSLNSYMWIVNTSAPTTRINAQMHVPCTYTTLFLSSFAQSLYLAFSSPLHIANKSKVNRNMLVALKPEGSSPSTMLTVAKRALNATSGQFLPINAAVQVVRELPEDRILVPELDQLDGQYVILVGTAKAVGQTLPAAAIVQPTKKQRRSSRGLSG
jgi:hypothetical protein